MNSKFQTVHNILLNIIGRNQSLTESTAVAPEIENGKPVFPGTLRMAS
jgi:hypothetical protein